MAVNVLTTYGSDHNANAFKYKFYDATENKIRDCKIYVPFSQFKNSGFEFKRLIGPDKTNNISARLYKNNKKIQMTYKHELKERWFVTNILFRDLNSFFVYDYKDEKCYGTNPSLLIDATYYRASKKDSNSNFNINKFFGDYYLTKEKGSGYVVGSLKQNKNLWSKKKDT